MCIPLTSVKGIESVLELSHYSISLQNTKSVQQEELMERLPKQSCWCATLWFPETPGETYNTGTDAWLSEFISEQIKKT